MRELLAAREWHGTLLGPPERWTPALSGAVRICVNSASPSLVAWGRDAALIYNRAAHALLGPNHPQALGLPARQTHLQLWDAVAAAAGAVMSQGEPRVDHERLLVLDLDGSPEERYFDVLMTPVLDGREVAGVLCGLTDTTARVRSRRRLTMLGELAHHMAAARSDDEVWAAAEAVLQRNPADLPFALLYRCEERDTAALLAGAIGLAPDDERAPENIATQSADGPWPLARVARTGEPLVWTDAIIEPIVCARADLCGFLVAGVNPRQPLDSEYADFMHQTAERIAVAIAHTRLAARNRERAEALERGRTKLERRCTELTQLYQQAPIPILVVRGPNFVVESINSAGQAAIPGRRVVGRPLFEAVAELADVGFAERLQRVVATGEPDVGSEVPVRLEVEGRLTTRYFTFISAPLQGGADDEAAVIIVASDVTPTIEARIALERSEARYRNIFDSVDVSIWEEDFSRVLPLLDELVSSGVHDLRDYFRRHPDFVRRAVRLVEVKDVNDATLNLFGATEKHQLRRSLSTIVLPETLHAYGEKLAAIHEKRGVVRCDTVARTLQGERLELMMTVARRTLHGDNDCTALVTLADITAHKRLEQALREADRHKDEFLATLAHELRNPLAPLRSSLDLLRRTPGDVPEAVLDIIERQVRHLARLADDLFESSRIRRGTFDLRKERVLLWNVLRNAIETSGPLLRGAGHQLDIDVPDEPVWLDGDPTRLAQVFANLLNNAARYTRPSGRVTITARQDGEMAEVAVTDTGIGISAESLPKLFTMFSRVGSGKDGANGGLGIGLALAKQLVEVHGGGIQAQSDGPGKGSRFTVRLPIAGVGGPDAPPAPRDAASIENRRILVVDDNVDAAASLRMLLEANGAEARVADSGPKALAAFASIAPEIVLLDIGMPGMNGYEVARRLRTEFADRPMTLIALTGWGRQEDIRRAQQAGFDHHLVKPVDINALLTLLATVDHRATGNGKS